MSKYTTLILISVIIVIVFLIGVYFFALPEPSTLPNPNPSITTFEECLIAGNPVMESYPRQCRSGEQVFVEYIGNELEKTDLIQIDTPRPNQKITSPLKISGKATGLWFFEGSFPIKLLDEQGNELVSHYAQAKGEWMTEEFVNFESEIEFKVPESSTGILILEKDNASGIPSGDDEVIVPVKF